MSKPVTRIAAVIFAFVAGAHLYRLISGFQLSAFGHDIPLWANVAGVLIAGSLSFGLFRESRS